MQFSSLLNLAHGCFASMEIGGSVAAVGWNGSWNQKNEEPLTKRADGKPSRAGPRKFLRASLAWCLILPYSALSW